MKNTKKKGFTLAELLIVVAIVAILAAIAIPLLIGATDKAETAVKNANMRTVTSLATVEILTDSTQAAKKGTNGWKATATVAADGTVSGLTIAGQADAVPEGGNTCVKSGNNYTVTVYISEVAAS